MAFYLWMFLPLLSFTIWKKLSVLSLDSSQRNLAGSKGSCYSQDSQSELQQRELPSAAFEEFILVLSITFYRILLNLERSN